MSSRKRKRKRRRERMRDYWSEEEDHKFGSYSVGIMVGPLVVMEDILSEFPRVVDDLKQLLQLIDNGQAVNVRGISEKWLVSHLKKLFLSLNLKGSNGIYLLPSDGKPVLKDVGPLLEAWVCPGNTIIKCSELNRSSHVELSSVQGNPDAGSVVYPLIHRRIIGPVMPSHELPTTVAKAAKAQVEFSNAAMEDDTAFFRGPAPPTLVAKVEGAKVADNFEEDTWEKLKSIINAIFLKQPAAYTLGNPYQAVNDLYLHKLEGNLYQRIEKAREAPSEVGHHTVIGLLRTSKCERLGEAVDWNPLNHLLKMFTALGIFAYSLEKPFQKYTSEFYTTKGMKYIQQSDVSDYRKHGKVKLHEEHERYLPYLDANTRKSLFATMKREFLERYIHAILVKGFMMLTDENRTEHFQRMYQQFFRVNSLGSLRQALHSYIRRTGHEIFADEEKDKNMVPSLREFKASLDIIWEERTNLRQNRPAELIAKFLDEKLRVRNKETSKEELGGTLDKFFVISSFTQGKDAVLSQEINKSFKQSLQARTKLHSEVRKSAPDLSASMHLPKLRKNVLRTPRPFGSKELKSKFSNCTLEDKCGFEGRNLMQGIKGLQEGQHEQGIA